MCLDGDSDLLTEGCPASVESGAQRLLWGFCNSEWVALCAAADAAVAQVPCDGWRRPSAASVSGPDDLTFCCVRGEAVHVYR